MALKSPRDVFQRSGFSLQLIADSFELDNVGILLNLYFLTGWSYCTSYL